ncbi:MAG: SPW repeat protein [Patescibacteria group bacterium]
MKWNYWALIVLGVWLIVSPWVLGFSDLNLVLWNNLMVGGLMIIFALWNLTPSKPN